VRAAGSALPGLGVFVAGRPSATPPNTTVVPQRERLAARGAPAAAGGTGNAAPDDGLARSVTR
jgi:hypothetical protein